MIICCPHCGKKMAQTGEYPDTGTSVDMYQYSCKSCKRDFSVAIELQDGSISITELD